MKLYKISNNLVRMVFEESSNDQDRIEIIFSYDEPISFYYMGLHITTENIWGPTTGKHIKRFTPDNGKLAPNDVFKRLFKTYFY